MKRKTTEWVCKICGLKCSTYASGRHLKTHGLSLREYNEKFDLIKEKKENKCICCGKILQHHSAKFCSEECKQQFQIEENNKKYEGIEDIVICKICGIIKNDLKPHITKVHKITIDQYREMFGQDIKIISDCVRKKFSDNVKGNKNPGFQHGGKLSPFSKKNEKYCNLTEEEINEEILKINKKRIDSTKESSGFNVTLDYWIKKCDGDIEQANILYKERQETFSLKKCTEKYGISGLEIWEERQEKWQNTLKNKSEEEIKEINRKKVPKTFNKKTYSNISQELFWIIYNKIKHKYKNIYFATLHNGEYSEKFNNEYKIMRSDNKIALLDFYIEDINFCIEFDGEYWHYNAQTNKTRDSEREKAIIKQNPELVFYRIREREYNKDKQKMIENILNKINSFDDKITIDLFFG